MSVSGEVNLSSSKVGLSSSKVILSSGKVGLSSMKVILSKILILKSIVCCVCVMFSSDVSWGSMEKNDEINDNGIPSYNVVLLGDSQVGKTQIINKKQTDIFETGAKATIGVDFNSLKVKITQDKSDQNIKLKVFDTAGEERFKSLIPIYVKQAHAVVFVYDITNKKSFENIQTWIQLAQKHADKEAVYFLVGNRQVTTEKAQKFAGDNNMTSFEVSAKDGTNINKLFEAIAKACVKKDIQIPTDSKNKRCNCCPCCNKDEEDQKEETKFPETTSNILTDNID